MTTTSRNTVEAETFVVKVGPKTMITTTSEADAATVFDRCVESASASHVLVTVYVDGDFEASNQSELEALGVVVTASDLMHQ